MSFEDNKIKRHQERKPFRDAVRIFCKINSIKQQNLAESLGITNYEFSHLLTGKLSSIPSKGIENYSDFEVKVIELLGYDFTEGHLQY
jgi:predicted XRE-type DNA-binding protein